MLNIEKIFDSLKSVSKENEVIVNCINKNAKHNALLSELEGSIRELVTKSISNIKKEIFYIQKIYGTFEPSVQQTPYTKRKAALMGTEQIQQDILRMNAEKYDAFLEMILKSEISVDQIEIFVEGYISVVYTGLRLSHKQLIKPMPALSNLLQCG